MLFLSSLRCSWWFGSYNLRKAMVEFQENLEGWLEDATLFLNEPINALFNYDVTSVKANEDVSEPLSILPDLGLEGEGWLDEMVCILDYPNASQSLQNDTEMLMSEDGVNILESLVNTNFDSSFLPMELNNDGTEKELEEFGLSLDSSQAETSSDSSFPPFTVQPESPISSVGSPASSSDNYSQSDSSVSVSIYNPPEPLEKDKKRVRPLKISKVFDLSEINVKEKLQSTGKIQSVHISLKASSHPYAPAKEYRSKKVNKYERKKVQNKEAAARYRIKKRIEDKELSDVVSGLEDEQKNLQEKHDQLKGEIKYLKSLMQEMFKAKGVL